MNTPSDRLKQELDKIKDNGCNLYMLMNRLKKTINLKRKRNDKPELGNFSFPEEALLRVCDSYWKYKPKQPWPWFLKVIDSEAQKQLMQEEDKVNEKYRDPAVKRSKTVPLQMKDALKQMLG